MINFDSKNRIFKLDTPNSSYVIGVVDSDQLVNLYYGSKIADAEGLEARSFRPRCASFSPLTNEHYTDSHDFSPDCAPMEYGCNGCGDFRVSALSIKNADGNTVTDMRYEGHRIYAGKPSAEPLPSVYLNSDSEADTLEIYMADKVTDIRVTLIYTVFNALDAIIRSAKIENASQKPADIERAMSLCVDLPSMDYDLITLYGRHAKERSEERRPLAHGLQGIASKRGVSSHCQNPFAALVSENADEDSGEAYGFNLVYSGNFEFCAECDFSGTSRIVMGINPNDFSWRLEPGESFMTPEAVIVYSNAGIGEMSRTYHRLYNNNLVCGKWKTAKRPLLINSWEAAYFDFDTEKLVSFAERAKELGMDMLVMDDGWFGERNDDRSSLGDWFVNESKLKGGLGELIDRVNALGLKFGIWYEPEMISPDSELFRAHPDWCVHVPNRKPCIGRHQYVLDMSRKDVRDNIFDQMYSVLSKYKIDYIKWDFNRNISDAGSALLPADRQGEFFHRFILGTYELMGRIRDAFPDMLFENCSGGGGRFDPAMLAFSQQIWASDNTDPIERLTIQFGTSMCYPASTMGAHVSACDRTDYKVKGDVALWGTFGYELDPNELSAEEREQVKKQVDEYHKYYDLIHSGDLYRLKSPYEDGYRCAWSFVAQDKSEALATVVTMRAPEVPFFILRFKGLDPEKRYSCDFDGRVYSGSNLMNAGLNLTRSTAKTYSSVKIYLKEEE